MLAGLFIAGLAAVLREATDTSVKSVEVLRGLTGGSVLASVGTQDKAQRQKLREHRSPNTEAYRSLRTNLQFLDVDHPVRVLTVTSSVPGEGKSVTACNLALALADAGKRVVLVDGDLRCPQVCAYLGCTSRAGLTSVLIGASLLEETLIEGRNRLLRILPSGPIPPNPSELLGSVRMTELVERLKQDADIVVIDSPPLLPVTDAAILSRASDGAILVVRHGQTRREQLVRATDQLRAVEARLLGSVLNRVPLRGPDADPYLAYGYYNSAQPIAPLPGLLNGASLLGAEDWRVNVGGVAASAQSRTGSPNQMTGHNRMTGHS
jgi:non-specific protein-tyrosine kinase